MKGALAPGVVLAVLAASLTTHAQQMLYTGNAMGAGTGKCATYRMAMDLASDGKTVKGQFKQQGRPDRAFEATVGANGALKAKVEVGGGSMEVEGTINDNEVRLLLDGYCKFEFRLTRK